MAIKNKYRRLHTRKRKSNRCKRRKRSLRKRRLKKRSLKIGGRGPRPWGFKHKIKKRFGPTKKQYRIKSRSAKLQRKTQKQKDLSETMAGRTNSIDALKQKQAASTDIEKAKIQKLIDTQKVLLKADRAKFSKRELKQAHLDKKLGSDLASVSAKAAKKAKHIAKYGQTFKSGLRGSIKKGMLKARLSLGTKSAQLSQKKLEQIGSVKAISLLKDRKDSLTKIKDAKKQLKEGKTENGKALTTDERSKLQKILAKESLNLQQNVKETIAYRNTREGQTTKEKSKGLSKSKQDQLATYTKKTDALGKKYTDTIKEGQSARATLSTTGFNSSQYKVKSGRMGLFDRMKLKRKYRKEPSELENVYRNRIKRDIKLSNSAMYRKMQTNATENLPKLKKDADNSVKAAILYDEARQKKKPNLEQIINPPLIPPR